MEPEVIQWDEISSELIELSLQWVIGQIVEGSLSSLAGVGQLANAERVTFTLNAEDDDAMMKIGKEEVVKSGVTHVALLGVATLAIEGDEVNVFVLYHQTPELKAVKRYLCAFEFQEEEDGETSIALSDWEEIDPLEESWLAA